MRNLRLLSTTAAVLLLGAGSVWAQDMKTNEKPGAPAAQQKAPVEKMAPALKSDQRKSSEKSGQATTPAPESDRNEMKSQKMDKGGATGAAAERPADAAGKNAEVKPKGTNNTDGSGAGAASPSAQSADEAKHSATAGSANLTNQQRTKITAVVMQHKVAPVRLDVAVRVGTRISDSVHFYPLPQEVFVIYPEWRDFDYILVGDEIVVLDPRTHEIVGILEA
jgi:hypothetical protein